MTEVAPRLIAFAAAAAIGLLIGMERERRHQADGPTSSFAGVRTFTLVGVSGALAGLEGLPPGVAATALVAIAGLTVIAYALNRRDEAGRGGTTEIAVILTFLLGLAAMRGHLVVAGVAGVAATILLASKEPLGAFAKSLSPKEVSGTLRLLAISVIVLPILPDQGYGPYEAFNPQSIWLMAVLISALSFVGYWLVKYMGADRGVALTGLVGGLASSTAATLSLARFSKDNKGGAAPVAAGVILANVMMLGRVAALMAASSPKAFVSLGAVIGAAAAAGAAAAVLIWRSAGDREDASGAVSVKNPFELGPAIVFAGVLAVVSLASAFAAERFGASGLFGVAFLSGLADVDAITLAVGRQSATGAVAPATAASVALVAVLANMIVKAGLASMIGGRRLGLMVAAGFAVIILAGAGTFLAAG